VFLSSNISAIFGMGGGLILMGALSIWLPLGQAMLVHGVIQFLSNAFRGILSSKDIFYRGTVFYILGSLLALGLWSFLLLTVSKPLMLILLGTLAFLPFFPLGKLRPDFLKTPHQILCGFLVTGIQLTAGAAGPVLDIFFTHTRLSKNQVIATKSMTQTFGHAVKVLYFGIIFQGSSLGPSDTPALLILIAATFLGTWTGKRIGTMVSEQMFRSLTRKMILALGVLYICRGVWLQVLNPEPELLSQTPSQAISD